MILFILSNEKFDINDLDEYTIFYADCRKTPEDPEKNT